MATVSRHSGSAMPAPAASLVHGGSRLEEAVGRVGHQHLLFVQVEIHQRLRLPDWSVRIRIR